MRFVTILAMAVYLLQLQEHRDRIVTNGIQVESYPKILAINVREFIPLRLLILISVFPLQQIQSKGLLLRGKLLFLSITQVPLVNVMAKLTLLFQVEVQVIISNGQVLKLEIQLKHYVLVLIM